MSSSPPDRQISANRGLQNSLPEIPGLVRQAENAYRRGDFLSAAQVYKSAAIVLRESGQSLDAAEMQNNAAVALLQGGDASGALALVEGTPELFARANDVRRQAIALGNLGMALDELGKLAEAAAAYEQSSGLLRQLGEFDQRLFVLQALSKVYFRQGKPLLAVTAMRAGVELLPHPSPRQRVLCWLLKIPDNFLPRPR